MHSLNILDFVLTSTGVQLISAGCIATSNIVTAVLTAMGARNGKIEFGTSMRLGVICVSLIQMSGTLLTYSLSRGSQLTSHNTIVLFRR